MLNKDFVIFSDFNQNFFRKQIWKILVELDLNWLTK